MSVTDAPALTRDQQQQWLLRDAVSRGEEVRKYRDYYAGKQPHALTTTQLTILEGLIKTTSVTATEWDTTKTSVGGSLYLCDNACRVIVDTIRSRLRVEGFSCPDADVLAAIQEDWTLNGLDDVQNDVHRDDLRDGNAYLLLGWDNEKRRVLIVREQQWVTDATGRHGDGMHIVYDGNRNPLVAIKEWVEDIDATHQRRRRTLYYADRIERYSIEIERGGAASTDWQPFFLPSDGGRWPAPWVDPATNAPLGIPVVHFRNETDSSNYGVSDLAGSIIGLQNAFNDTLHALLAAGRMTGYQMYAATGVGKASADQWKVGPGQIWGDQDPLAKITPLAPADLQPLIDEGDHILAKISNNSDLPIHAFTGNWPSGEALMRSEVKLIAKAEVRQARNGRAWASAMHKATLLRNAFGGEELNTEALIATRWRNATLRDEKYVVDLVNAKKGVLSDEQALRELGYTEDEIATIQREKQAEARFQVQLQQAKATPPALN